jgi:PmbA protein
MENPSKVAEIALGALKKFGADKAQVDVGVREVHEVNVEAGRFTLMRSTFDQGIGFRAIKDQKQATMSGNQFEEQTLMALAEQTVATAKTSSVDEAADVAPMQSAKKFKAGLEAGDLDLMTAQAELFLQTLRSKYPRTILEQMTVQFAKRHRAVANTNGVHFETQQGDYETSVMFTSKDGKKTSSFNYNGFSALDFNASIMEAAGTEELIRQSGEQTEAKVLNGKFVGDILVTPHCLPTFIGGFTGYLGTGALLKKQSPYQEKLGQKVASEKFTLRCEPLNEDFSSRGFVTGDGFLTENVNIVEKGVLKTFVLDQYGSNKVKQERMKCDNAFRTIDAGDVNLSAMIKSIKRGVLLCRFSGGYPASNGDISGVAKNSYYIENGEIQYPVSEVMVSGNIPQMLLGLRAISKERLNFGSAKLPWIHFDGFTISGK